MLGRHERAAEWLRVWADLGRAPRTIDAYARALAEYLNSCEAAGVDPITANRAHLASFVRELTSRPGRCGPNVVSLDSGAGLSNATLQQRLVAVRLLYDYLIEEGMRESNPVGRDRYTPGRVFGAPGQRGLVPRVVKLPWIPSEQQWLDVLAVFAQERDRNRLMLALAYDAALRREELCSLRTDDLDPARRMLRVRAETTKTPGADGALFGADWSLAGALPGSPLHVEPGPRPFVSIRVAPQPGRAADAVDLVEGGPPGRAGLGRPSVLHAHDAAPVFDRPGADGLGPARHRHLRRTPLDRVDAALYPAIRA